MFIVWVDKGRVIASRESWRLCIVRDTRVMRLRLSFVMHASWCHVVLLQNTLAYVRRKCILFMRYLSRRLFFEEI